MQFHPRAGHLTVVPIARSQLTRSPDSGRARPIRRRLLWTLAGFGTLAVGGVPARAARRQHAHSAWARSSTDRFPYADNIDAQIFFVARLPRVLAAALVGSALALVGRRVPGAAAEPAGVAGHARRLGGRVARRDDGDHASTLDFSLLGVSAVPLASFAGSLGALAIVYGLSAARRRGTSAVVLLLGGVTLHAAAVGGDRVRAVPGRLHRDVPQRALADGIARRRVLLADRSRRSCRWRSRGPASPRCRACSICISVGSESAAARGVDVERTERIALVSASLATGAAVSLAGPVSFVGIIVPHLVRLIVGADHRLVLPASALFGAAFLIGCDLVARTVIAPLELPVGIVTAIIGGPVFLWLLFRRA